MPILRDYDVKIELSSGRTIKYRVTGCSKSGALIEGELRAMTEFPYSQVIKKSAELFKRTIKYGNQQYHDPLR